MLSGLRTSRPRKMATKDKKDRKTGRLFIVSAPSGAGKTTLSTALLKAFPDMVYSVSSTTRAPRPGEKNGVDYFFVEKKDFEKGIESGLWVEWAKVHDHYYGTSARFLDQVLLKGRHILLDIDVQGARQITARYLDAVTIFIMAPSIEVLRQRLKARGADSPAVIEKRMINAEKEIACKKEYMHVFINDDLETAGAALIALVEKYMGT